jgi:hypothetical protein
LPGMAQLNGFELASLASKVNEYNPGNIQKI